MYTCTGTPNAQLYKSRARNFEALSLPSTPYITAMVLAWNTDS
jgi:hypothetical protein